MIRQAMVAGALLALWLGGAAAAAQFGSPPRGQSNVVTVTSDGTGVLCWTESGTVALCATKHPPQPPRDDVAVTTDHAVLSAAAFVAALLLAAAAWTLRRARQTLAEARAAGRSMGAAPTTRETCRSWGCDCRGAP